MKDKREIKSVLITGISGSGGSYLAEHIVANKPDVKVHGITRWHSTTTSDNLSRIDDRVTLHECDLNDFSSICSVIEAVKPDAVFHLASHANVRAGFTTPIAVLQNNIMGTANFLEALRLSKSDPIVQICSSSEVYGQVDPANVPITEECPIQPTSPYAVSKLTQDMLGLTYYRSYGLRIIRTRMFAYLNPRRADLFATSFALQVARIENGMQEQLFHGNLASVRTLIDVRDAMSAYWYAIERCEFGEAYNIGGQKTVSVGEFLEILKGLSTVSIKSCVDERLLRPADVTLQIPNVDKFTNLTGWEPKFSFEESVEHLLNHCRQSVFRQTLHQKI